MSEQHSASDRPNSVERSACYGNDTCPTDATTTLVNWFDRVGPEVRALDPGALVGSGELTSAQCGWAGGGELRRHLLPIAHIARTDEALFTRVEQLLDQL